MPKWRAAQESLSAISWMTVGFVATRAESSAKNNYLTQISLVLAEALSLARLKSLPSVLVLMNTPELRLVHIDSRTAAR